jgi:hypothetical protein
MNMQLCILQAPSEETGARGHTRRTVPASIDLIFQKTSERFTLQLSSKLIFGDDL